MPDPITATINETPSIDVGVESTIEVSVSVTQPPEISVTVDQPNSDSITVSVESTPSINVEIPAEITYDLSVSEPPEILVQIMEVGESTGISGWVTLKDSWTSEPTLIDTIADGEVYEYEYGSTTYYRLVPSPYDSTLDQFFSSFSTPTLSGLLATRGVPI